MIEYEFLNSGLSKLYEERYSEIAEYHLCNCCPAIAHRYRREKKAVDSFCKDNQLQLKLEDGAINIASPQDCWKIIVNGKNKNLLLYHKNSFEKKYEVVPSIVPGYHS